MESKQSCDTLNAVTVDESRGLQPQVAILEYGLCSFRRCFARGFSVVLLLWQLVGSVLYFIRAYSCCIEQREASFRCSHAAAFPHSQEYELAWLISLNAYIILFTFILSKIPGFFRIRCDSQKSNPSAGILGSCQSTNNTNDRLWYNHALQQPDIGANFHGCELLLVWNRNYLHHMCAEFHRNQLY